MKKLLTRALVFVIGATCASAQTQKEINKENKARDKYAEQQLNERASKAARKEAKKYAKDGWIVAPGHLPLDKQLERSWLKYYDEDENGPINLRGEAISVGEYYDAAKMQAIELAKMQIAGQLETIVVSKIKTTVGNQQLSEGDAASLVETVQASQNMIVKKLGLITPVVECYRDAKKKKEVRVVLIFNRKNALDAAKECVREELKKTGNEMHKDIDNLNIF